MTTLIWILVGSVSVSLVLLILARRFIGAIFGLYRVVPVNEAHIRIYKNTKEVFSSRTSRSCYWYIPFMMKLHKLPLCNLSIPVNDIKLNDKDMAKFVCDIMCFVVISDIPLAVERLSLTDTTHELGFDFQRLSEDLRAIMESIGRTVTTKQTILDIYRDRSALDNTITKEVEAVFPKWGISLVDLELKDIKDVQGSTIISDIEALRAAEIRRDAEIKVANATKEAEIGKALAEEAYRKQQIEKDRQIALAEQKKNEEVATAKASANKTMIAAERELQFGQAEINRQVTEKNAEARRIQLQVEAEGQKQKLIKESEGEAQKVLAVGEAQAKVVQMQKEADAAGTEKQAEALAKFNSAAMGVKVLETQKEIATARFKAYAEALSKAQLKLIMTGANASKFFGLNIDAESGSNVDLFSEQSGINAENIAKVLKLIKSQVGEADKAITPEISQN